jgi:hypothetical protein
MLDRLDYMLRKIRGSEHDGEHGGSSSNEQKPFGGIQLAFFGDFLQLAPVPESVEQRINSPTPEQWFDIPTIDQRLKVIRFMNRGRAFQSHLWRAANFEAIQLQKVHRQSDAQFVQALNAVRERRDLDYSNGMPHPVDLCYWLQSKLLVVAHCRCARGAFSTMTPTTGCSKHAAAPSTQ